MTKSPLLKNEKFSTFSCEIHQFRSFFLFFTFFSSKSVSFIKISILCFRYDSPCILNIAEVYPSEDGTMYDALPMSIYRNFPGCKKV